MRGIRPRDGRDWGPDPSIRLTPSVSDVSTLGRESQRALVVRRALTAGFRPDWDPRSIPQGHIDDALDPHAPPTPLKILPEMRPLAAME